MSQRGIVVRFVAAMVVATVAFPFAALAQNRSDVAAPSEATSILPPAWAYPVNPPGFKLAPDDGTLRRVPDSSVTYTLPQVRDRFFAPDWHPGDHAPLPEVVAHGRKPDVSACGYCHRADGSGGPENSSLAGLPAAYIVQQMTEYKNGTRKGLVPQRVPIQLMITSAKAATDAEIAEAAAYFSGLKPKPTIRVVETDAVPKTYVAGWFLAAVKNGDKEPIVQRIIEVPEDLDQFENRDSSAPFVAYVPIGSVAAGAELVKSGGAGKTIPCGTCHGVDLKGVGPIPRIAGRSPSFIFRQLFDVKHGAREVIGVSQMKPVVEKLAVEDMVSLAAYLASLTP
jgi:cytochrome c553